MERMIEGKFSELIWGRLFEFVVNFMTCFEFLYVQKIFMQNVKKKFVYKIYNNFDCNFNISILTVENFKLTKRFPLKLY